MARRDKKMTEDVLATIVRGLLNDARDYAEEIGEMRINATDAYNGKPYGNEKVGRSQIVTREVRDAVRMAMPSVMRVLFGSKSQIEFEPNSEEDVPHARDATDYILKCVRNDGYMEFYNAAMDALIRKTGVLKPWWDVSTKPKRTTHTGLSEDQLEILASDEAVREVVATPRDIELPGPDGQPTVMTVYDAEVIRMDAPTGRLKFEAIPVEELVVSRDARSITQGTLAGHMRNLPISDLVDMGYDPDVLDDIAGTVEDLSEEKEARSQGNTDDITEDNTDPSQREVMFAECWVRVDYDGDGIAELRRICVAGSACEVLENELADEVMLADLCPSPVAHQAIGDSLAELVEDIQRIKSMVLRNTMDSLANTIHPDVVGVLGQVNFDDLLNTENSRIIRANAPGMVDYLKAPFVGNEAYQLLQYLDTAAESRTGLNQASQGLNADALQSTAKAAIDNATQSAQAQIELIVRTFLETGIKRLYKLMLKLTVENADRAMKMRLNNRFVEVDPRSWNAGMDVQINMALGQGSDEQRMAVLNVIAAKQEQIIQLAGPDNPLAGIQEYRNTLAEMARIGGVVDVESYFKDPRDAPPQQPKTPTPDPQQVLAEAEAKRIDHEITLKEREFRLNVWKAAQEDDRKRDDSMAKWMLEAEKLRAEGKRIDTADIERMVNAQRDDREFLFRLSQEGTAYQTEQQQMQAQQVQQRQQAAAAANPSNSGATNNGR